MSSLFSTPQVQPQTIETTPTIVDKSKKTLEVEAKRKKKLGIASQFVSGNASVSGNSVRKTLLGE